VSQCPIEFLRILENVCSGREVNKKMKKQHVCCINNVYDVVDSDFLEAAFLLQMFQKKVVRLEQWIFTFCALPFDHRL